MNKTLMSGLAVLAVIVVLGGGYLLLNKGETSTVNETAQMEMTPAAQNTTETTSSTTEAMSKNEVSIQNFSYSPATITVKVGDKVTWTNKDSVGHTATADDGSFDTGLLAQGESKTVTFSKAGTFTYHCTPHPYMKGKIVVQAQ